MAQIRSPPEGRSLGGRSEAPKSPTAKPVHELRTVRAGSCSRSRSARHFVTAGRNCHAPPTRTI
jgi:hypothetical protein